jgi:hypothetical protein
VQVKNADGSPAAGVAVGFSDDLSGRRVEQATTNKRGVARFAITPEIQPADYFPKRNFWLSVTVDGVSYFQSHSPNFYSCPFPKGPFGLTVHVAIEHNNGIGDKREQDFANRDVTLSFGGPTLQGTLDRRLYKLNSKGMFSTTLFQGGAPFSAATGRGAWGICLTDREVARGWQIVSLSGAVLPVNTLQCVGLPPLTSGDNDFTIGVARTGSAH